MSKKLTEFTLAKVTPKEIMDKICDIATNSKVEDIMPWGIYILDTNIPLVKYLNYNKFGDLSNYTDVFKLEKFDMDGSYIYSETAAIDIVELLKGYRISATPVRLGDWHNDVLKRRSHD